MAYDTQTDPTTLPTGATPTYDKAGELTTSTKGSTTTAYSYDTIGARTKVDPTTGPTTTYGYTATGQMTSATSSATTGPLSGTGMSFTYGATGIPLSKTTNTGATTTLVWGTGGGSPELLAAGATYLVRGPTGRVVEQVDTTTTTPTFLVTDQLGSTRLLTNQAGTVVGTYSWDAYGNEISHTGTATTPIGYAGGVETAATGLVDFEHRWFTTGTASWLTVDPLVATTTAPYTYATNDPTNLTDPSGDVSTQEVLNLVCGLGGEVPYIAAACEGLALKTVVTGIACQFGNNTPSYPCPGSTYRGVLQAQGTYGNQHKNTGKKLTKSKNWSQGNPPTLADGLDMIVTVASQLTTRTYNARKQAFKTAAKQMAECAARGGCSPSPNFRRSWHNRGIDPAQRVDLVIYKGRAFIPTTGGAGLTSSSTSICTGPRTPGVYV